MSDVFISYKRENLAAVGRLVEALRAEGVSVWWDRDIAPNAPWEATIENALAAAKLVIVAWSPASVASDNVKAEARWARGQSRLLQVFVEACEPPLFFGERQGVDLTDWSGAASDTAFRNLLQAVRGGPTSTPEAAPRDAPTIAKPADPLLAVLAFDNLSADPELAFFSEGVSAEIQQTVACAADLKVIARASSFQFRGPDKSARRVATELKVTHILDGSVRRSGSRVRISTELIRCQDEATVWSDRFDRDLTDVFAVQDEIAAAVAAALKVAFAGKRPAEPITPAAYDLFLKAQVNTFVPDRRDIELLESVTALAPEFAPGWASLSLSRAFQLKFGERDERFAEERVAAMSAAKTALRLDPRSGTAFVALSWLQPPGRYAEQERLLRDALALIPNDPLCLTMLGTFYDTVGRTREALESVRRAYELDPLYPPAVSLLAGFLLRAGAYEDGQRLYAEGRRRWPGDPSLYVPPLAWAAHAQDWDRYNSIVEAGTAVGANVYPAWLALIDFAAASRGHYPKYAQELLTRLEAQVQDSGAPALDALTSAFKLGKQEQVFDILERASYASMFEEGGANPTGHYIPGMIFDRSIRGLMIDSRFPRLCAKLGLVDYWTKSGRWPDCAEAGVLPYNFRAECQKLAG
jgi:TolB-like protein